MPGQYDILDYLKHHMYIICIDSGREIMIEVLTLVPTNRVKHPYHETLHLFEVMRVTFELREIPADTDIGRLHLLLEEVRLIEEDHYRYISETPVIDDGLKDVETLYESVCDPVLEEGLVEGAGGNDV